MYEKIIHLLGLLPGKIDTEVNLVTLAAVIAEAEIGIPKSSATERFQAAFKAIVDNEDAIFTSHDWFRGVSLSLLTAVANTHAAA